MLDTRILGNLVRDPDLRSTPEGDSVCSFVVACNFKRKGEAKVQYVKVTVWRQLAENCGKYLKKGSKVYVDGGMDVDTYQKDGKDRFILEIYDVKRVEFLSSGDGGNSQSRQEERTDSQSGYTAVETDELPF